MNSVAFAEGLSVVDFLGDESRWKLEMANGTCGFEDVCLFSPADLRCTWSAFLHERLKPFAKKRLPFLVDAGGAWLARLRRYGRRKVASRT